MSFRTQYLFYFILFFMLPNCSTKQSFISLSKDLRQIDIISYEDKKVIKTYYQTFNKKIYEWVNVSCEFIQTRFETKEIKDCSLTKLSKLLIKKKESVSELVVSKNTELNISKNVSKESEKTEDNQPIEPDQLPNEIESQDFDECNDPQKC